MNSSLEANDRAGDRGLQSALHALLALIASLIVFAGVSLTSEPLYDKGLERNERLGFFTEHGLTRLNISVGHYPPPGECRIWFLDVSANLQSPAGDCKELVSRMPAGAWLIRRWKHDVNHAHITVYDSKRPGEVAVAVGLFDLATGSLVFELK